MISQNVYILQSQFSDDIFFDFWVAVAVNARKGIFGNVFSLKSSSKRVENHVPIAIHNAPRQ
jgi:hypothetical protein